ncbi:MAG: NAD(P)/FAD-dependent oxidoreductase [Nitrospinota bacterium]
MSPYTADVIVVGGGPAGSATAALLAAAGVEVLLLDRAVFPRDKPCGAYLAPGCMRFFSALGVQEDLARLGPLPVGGVELVAPSGQSCLLPFGQVPAWSLPRRTLDAALLAFAKQRGAGIGQGCRVEGVVRDGDRVVGVVARGPSRVETLRASVVVGADGRNSVVARRLGLFGWNAALRRVALLQDFRPVTAVGHTVGVHLGPGRYAVLNPQPGGLLHLGLVAPMDTLSRTKGLRHLLAEGLRAAPGAATRLTGSEPVGSPHAIAPLAFRVRAVGGPGFLLVGDAAGYADPLIGDGVYRALLSATVAAEAILDGRRRPEPPRATPGLYTTRLREALRDRDRLLALLLNLSSRPWLIERLTNRFARQPDTARQFLDVVGGLQPARSLLAPGFWTRLFLPRCWAA